MGPLQKAHIAASNAHTLHFRCSCSRTSAAGAALVRSWPSSAQETDACSILLSLHVLSPQPQNTGTLCSRSTMCSSHFWGEPGGQQDAAQGRNTAWLAQGNAGELCLQVEHLTVGGPSLQQRQVADVYFNGKDLCTLHAAFALAPIATLPGCLQQRRQRSLSFFQRGSPPPSII